MTTEYDRELVRVRKAMAKVDKLLSDAQQVIGSELSNAEVRTTFRVAYKKSNEAYDLIEQARRKIQR